MYVQNAISEAQERTRKETEKKNAMWGRISKAVDEAMEAKPPGNIENTFLDCALPFQQRVDKANAPILTTGEKTEKHSDRAQVHKVDRPQGKTGKWAERATPNRQTVTGEPTLAQLLKVCDWTKD